MKTPAAEFSDSARRNTADLDQRQFIQKALSGYYVKRDENKNRFQSWAGARDAAAEIKWDAVNHLDRYLVEFASKLEARGVKVFWAENGSVARDYILQLARANKVRSIIKSKTMTGEEIHLNEALEKEGYEIVESDLGEYIVQLRQEPPYHFVFPAMHLKRKQISDLFQDKLGSPPTDQPEELTMTARRVMRQKFCAADMGITGANFAVAETGMISITENEGNARLTASLPKIHVAIVGIEKVLPKLADLALFLPMLATLGTGQSLTCYNTLYGAPRMPGEPDGPKEFHVVLLDNRRTQLLADAEQRDALHCIRCGACLNVCPIFKNVGGHSYGTTYQGPIGSVITPHLRGLQDWKHLSSASSLCGACTEACPVKINLHHHLLHNRRNAAQARPSLIERMMYRSFVFTMVRPRAYQLVTELARLLDPFRQLINGTLLDPLRPWTKTRSFPPFAEKSFRDLWRERSSGSKAPVAQVSKPADLSGLGSCERDCLTEAKARPEALSDRERASQSPISKSANRPIADIAETKNNSNGRETILARIREALKIAAPHPSEQIRAPQQAVSKNASLQQWLPPVGKTLDDQIELFRQNAQTLKAEFQMCPDLPAAIQFIKNLAAKEGWKKIGVHDGELTGAIAGPLGLPTVKTNGGYAIDALESCDVGITECEALIAQTGTVLVSGRGSGGRTLSVLPPHHIVLARRNQMVPDLTVAFEKALEKLSNQFPGILSLITGPSRTGDIERILVLGAHGPKRLTILLIG
ncbi:MAG TPA: LutB/LldF family L-lactate oxidation iron-sulfur protein [Verrucomicrobiae bacterium]|jgi:L-lactate dehydrogenase complex protein LldF|nr:LutB/LldF family L-lactate oxidation iron-sulfur protein [Verrucomicrobiae bacterium]